MIGRYTHYSVICFFHLTVYSRDLNIRTYKAALFFLMSA